MRKFSSRFFSPTEAMRLIRLGIPVYVAQLSGVGMSVVDTIMTGQSSAVDMAAVAVASSIWNPLSLFGVGVLLAMTPLCAQLVGENRSTEVPHLLRQGLWCAFFMSVPIMCIFFVLSTMMESFGLEEHLATLAGGYLRAVLWGLPGFYLFINIRGMLEGFSRTRPAMVISLFALLLNIPVNYIFIYGKFGLPAMGAVGCGVATALCFWVMGVCMVFFVRKDATIMALGDLFKPIFVKVDTIPRISWHDVFRIFRIGTPSALAVVFEVSLFAVSALALAPLGTVAVAGHQVAMNVSHVLFILPLSIAMTCTIRVGYCLGARQFIHARITAWTALTLGFILSFLSAVMIFFLRQEIPYIYNDEGAVVELTATLLLYAAMYQVVDTTQIVSVGVLRGYNDTTFIFIMGFICYWIIGFPLGYILSRTSLLVEPMGPAGFWIAFIVALAFGAVCYLLRVMHLQRQNADSIWDKIHR